MEILKFLIYLVIRLATPAAVAVILAGITRRWASKTLVRVAVLLLFPIIAGIAFWWGQRSGSTSGISSGEALVIAFVYLVPIGLGVLLVDNLSGKNPPTRRDITISAFIAGVVAPLVAPIIWVFGCTQRWTECP